MDNHHFYRLHHHSSYDSHFKKQQSALYAAPSGKINGDSTASMSPFYQANHSNPNATATETSTNDGKKHESTTITAPDNQTNNNNKKKNENDTTVAATSNAAATSTTTSTITTGIGGQGGVVYDVNKLKRNLLQETMRDYKHHLVQYLVTAARQQPYCDDDDDDGHNHKRSGRRRRNNNNHQKKHHGHVITEQDVVDKLAALVQASPVRTTTDSNLLDGTWHLILESQNAWVSDLYQPSMLEPPRKNASGRETTTTTTTSRKRPTQPPPQQQSQQSLIKNRTLVSANNNTRLQKPIAGTDRRGWWWSKNRGGPHRHTIRTYRLEDLPPTVDPHVLEETVWYHGLWKQCRRSVVTGLTRRSLTMEPSVPQWFVLGKYPVLRQVTAAAQAARPKATPATETVEVVYLDVDLCILAPGGGGPSPNKADSRTSSSSKNGDAAVVDQRPFAVYTKDVNLGRPPRRHYQKARRTSTTRKVRRWLRGLGHAVRRVIMPWRGGSHDKNAVGGRYRRRGGSDDEDPLVDGDLILQEFGFDNNQGKLRVLKIGDLKEYDESWDGPTDPFAHLSADERQEILKRMNMKEISQAGKQKLKTGGRHRRHGGWLSNLPIFGRRTFYRGPDSLSDLKP